MYSNDSTRCILLFIAIDIDANDLKATYIRHEKQTTGMEASIQTMADTIQQKLRPQKESKQSIAKIYSIFIPIGSPKQLK